MSEEIKKAIEQVDQKFVEAGRNHDAAAMAKLYTEDACILAPNTEMIRGRQAIQEFWGQGLKQMGFKDIKLTTVELFGSGDTVNAIGNYYLKFKPGGQELMEDKGKYIVIWKKTPKGWKMHWDMWNTSLPLPG